MKKYCFVLFVSFLFSFAKGQQVAPSLITANSTADECVEFINKKLKTAIGSSGSVVTITDARFTGGKYIYQTEYFTSKRPDNFHTLYQTHAFDINWAAYQSISATKYAYYNALYIKVAFNKSHPAVVQSKYYNFFTGAMDGSHPSRTTDTLAMYASLTEEASLNDLDLAFKRLSQLAKANPTLFKSEGFIPKVIEGKASFSETIDYIYNNFPKELNYSGNSYDQYGNYEGAVDVKYKNIKITQLHKTDSMLIEWSYDYRVPKYLAFEERKISKRIAILFSIKDVEKLNPFNYTYLNGFVTLEKARDATFPCGIGLFAKQGKKLFRVFEYNYTDQTVNIQMQSDVGLPTAYYNKQDNIETVQANIKNGQLYKAFNHLRNLCGAPDPLKFD